MYGVNQQTQDVVSDKSSFPVGINDNVKMEAVFERLSEDKDPLLQLIFTKSVEVGGKTKHYELKEILWPIDENGVKSNIQEARSNYTVVMPDGQKVKVAKGQRPSPQVAIVAAYNRFNSRIKHVLGAFLEESETIFEANSYADLAKKFIAKLERSDDPVNLLVEYDSDGKYTQVPRYGAFLERMNIPEEHSELQKRVDRENVKLTANRPQTAGGGQAAPSAAPASPPAPTGNAAPSAPPAPVAPPTS